MKSSLLFLSAFLLMSSVMSHAYQGFSVCNYGKGTKESVICYGPVVMKGTRVLNHVKVTGSFRASDVNLNTLEVIGSVNIKNSLVSGQVKINGELEAESVQFLQNILILSDKVSFHQSSARQNLIVQSQNEAVVNLQCGSSVMGDIQFKGKKGIVKINDDSIIKGKVLNGAIQFIRVDCD